MYFTFPRKLAHSIFGSKAGDYCLQRRHPRHHAGIDKTLDSVFGLLW